MSFDLDAIVEVDSDRGVIYIHSKDTGATVLRICNLPTPIPLNNKAIDDRDMLDITHMFGTSWDKDK